MAMQLMAGKFDQTATEGEGGGYYVWSNSTTPLLSQFKVGAGKLRLQPRGFALPHYADASKIGYVTQGSCLVGFVSPNSSEEKIVEIKKGDAIPVSMGGISWWFNHGYADVVIIFLGESAKALVPGQFTYFLTAGPLGILAGLQSDFVARTFNLNYQTDASTLVHNQPTPLIISIDEGMKFPEPSKHVGETLYAPIDTPKADVVVKEAGMINSLTEKKVPLLGEIGLSARFVKLEENAMLAPSYVADGSVMVTYVTRGSGLIRIVGSTGKADLDTRVEEGDMFIVPQFFVAAGIADESGMELFSVLTSSMPVVGQMSGKGSIWNALSPKVLQAALNINPELSESFKSANTKSITLIPEGN